MRQPWSSIFIAAALMLPATAWAQEPGHTDPLAPVVLGLAIVLVSAKLGGGLMARLGQPSVLGELLAGVLLGALPLVGVDQLRFISDDPTIDMLSRLGVLILLFEVGLESTIAQMLSVGWSSLLVAFLGVLAPLGLGWLVGVALLPGAGTYAHLFLGATLSATSVGITARVLKDLGRAQSAEARIILGASVIDDVLGLVILTVVTGAIAASAAGTAISLVGIGAIVLKASAFLVVALVVGARLSGRVFLAASRLRTSGVLLAIGLSFCFLLAWLSSLAGLAPIVGAFAAGLILEKRHYEPFEGRGERALGDYVNPIASFLVPVFFVLMGMKTDLRAFASTSVLALAAVLTLAAIFGKQLCSLGVLTPGVSRLAVGIGMIPRGEVGLIFANVGLSLRSGAGPVLTPPVFAAIVVMVMATTVVTPPALKWSLRRSEAG